MSRSERQEAGPTQSNPDAVPEAGSPAALCEVGLGHLQAGRNLEAQLCCRQALAIDPSHADTLHLMGLLCLDAQQHDHALEWLARAIQQDPKPEYLTSLGNVLQQAGRHEDALKAFDKAVQLKPDVAEFWKNLGNVLVDLERPADALLAYQHALTLNPRHWQAAHQSGYLLYNSGRFEEAIPYLDLCLEQQRDHFATLQLRALSLRGLKRFGEALADNQRAYALVPGDADTCNNIGDALHSLDRHEEALSWFDRAIALRPDFVSAISNKAFLLGQMQRFDEAFAVHQGLRKSGTNTPATDWNLSLLQMLTGNFEAGWFGREARWSAPVLTVPYPAFEQPMWLGEGSIAGKTVLIHADEGLGDCIQFARYVPDVAARGARVILVVAQAIHSLLARLPGVSECLPLPGGPLPAFDLHCPLSSLPLAFKTRLDTIPSATSYLPPPPEARVQAWEDRLGPHDKLRVGLVWSGNPAHGNDRNRSIPLRMLSRILDVDATFVSLQKNPKADDQATLQEYPEIIDLTADLTDFNETAALVCCLDLMITVDTSVAHLSAALGRPTWILLPFTPDYRWLLDRDDSPWYPTARLFRQDKSRDYVAVLDRVRNELAALTAARKQPKPENLSDLAATPHQGPREEARVAALDQAVRLGPDDPELWKDRGQILAELNRPDEALASFQRALDLNPRYWDAACGSGVILYGASRFEEALRHFDLCDKLRPNHAPMLCMRACSLRNLGKLEQALVVHRQAFRLDPRNAETSNNIGEILQSLGRYVEALPWLDRSLALRPDWADALNNRGITLVRLQRFDEAASAYRRAHALDPDNATISWNLAMLQMLTGDFDAGWAGREARWKIPWIAAGYPKFSQPMWLGEQPLEGKTILIYADEGLGDAFQFARYLPELAARGARVILMVAPPAQALLARIPGVALCLAKSAGPYPPFDLHCAMSSLPLAFGTRLDTIPCETPYLPPPTQQRVEAWQARLGAHDRLRVGLVWSGSPTHLNDHNRSLPLRKLSRLLNVDATFVSLQTDPRPDDQATLRKHREIIDLTADLTDFSETAALVSCLDLVITVDTSVAHLAAALGRPTWILLPYTPDYRWLLDRDDSPWYPTARLFRQDESRDYAGVIDRVRSELTALIGSRQLC